MKGYLILWLITAVVVASLPPLLLPASVGQADDSVAAPTERELTVSVGAHTQTMSLEKLARFETMASIAPDAPLEAIKAQAVAVYTALCYQYEQGAAITTTALAFPEGYTEAYWREQWGDAYEKHAAAFEQAFAAVKGKRVLYDGEAIMAVTHAMNSGTTENGEVLFGKEIPYLKSVASTADVLDVGQLTTVTVSTADASLLLKGLCGEVTEDARGWFGEPVKTTAGTVTSITVCGKTLTGAQLQAAFSLRSASFEVNVQDTAVIFTVHGSGHFVGMSVCGAIGMAKDGHSFDAILRHYYADVTVA